MQFPVIRGASYFLTHAPTVMIHHGTTFTQEQVNNGSSQFLKKTKSHIRDYESVVGYPANQVFIGNMDPDELSRMERPWYDKGVEGATVDGPYGGINNEAELYGWMKICDTFDLVALSSDFTARARDHLSVSRLVREEDLAKLGSGVDEEEIRKAVEEKGAEELRLGEELVGCVRAAHASDANLAANVIFENLVTKSTAVIALRGLIVDLGVDPDSIDYIIEASEEACGDMNQRGGGNFAKAIGEIAWCKAATGSDTRSFCAAPAHALVNAAALVRAGVYKNVVVVAGGAVAKLGMNAREHVAKGIPILEDCLGAFAVLVSDNDGVNPIIRTDLIGRHMIGSGASPQAVMSALVTDPLNRGGLTVLDVDKYSPEMQNPDITQPAGAGDVPKANLKMIGALGVMKGQLERAQLDEFVIKHGLPGFAPTQGHIPSGVPYIGFARDKMIGNGEMRRVMIIGKGSLFLGRMTNQFDGISFVMEKNPGEIGDEEAMGRDEIRRIVADSLRSMADRLIASD